MLLKEIMVSVNTVRWTLRLVCCVWVLSMHAESVTVMQSFHDRFFSAKEELTENFYQQFKDETRIKMWISTLWTKSVNQLYGLPKPRVIPFVIRVQNDIFLLSGMDLWWLKEGKLTSFTTLPSPFHEHVSFIKGIKWHQTLFLLLCFENSMCSLFTSDSGIDFSYYQTISDAGTPIDAQFFIQNDTVFLIMLFQAPQSMISQVRLYRWYTTNFDLEVIPKISTTASTITVFSYRENIILIFGCSSVNRIKFPSQVWCRKPSGEVTIIQNLPTSKPISITHFIQRGANFLMVQEENQDTIIYWWEGREFVEWITVGGMLKYFNVFVSSDLSTTFLIFIRDVTLKVCFMTSSKLETVFETEITNEDPNGSIVSVTMYEEHGKTYMFLLSRGQDDVFISLVLVNILSDESRNRHYQTGNAQETLDQIFGAVKVLENRMNTLNIIMPMVLLTNKPITIKGDATVSEAVKVNTGNIMKLSNAHTTNAWFIEHIYPKIYALRKDISTYTNTLQMTREQKSRHIVFEGNVRLKEAKINSLFVETVNHSPFEADSFLSLTNFQKLKSIKAKTVKTNWLALTKIGDKPIQDVLLREPVISVPIETTQLESQNIQINEDATINNITLRDLGTELREGKGAPFDIVTQMMDEPNTLQLQENSVIENLYVDNINNVSLNRLMASLVNKYKKNIIHGNLQFDEGLRANNLVYKKLVGYSQEQYTKTKHGTRYRPFPVDRIKREDGGSEGNQVKTMRTRLKIIGNLKVDKLLFKNSSLKIANYSVPTTDLDKTFWTRSSPQVIPGPVLFTEGVTILNDLESSIVNDKNLTHFGTIHSDFHSLTFDNIHVVGDITTKNVKNKDSEMLSHSQSRITKGFKCNTLEVTNLQTKYIKGKNIQNALLQNQLSQTGTKTPKSITTENLIIKGDLRVDWINEINVRQKFSTAVLRDRGIHLEEAIFKHVSARSAQVDYMNGVKTNLLLSLNKNISMNGNLHVSQLRNVAYVNGKPVNLTQVVNKRKGAVICGRKRFPSQVSTQSEIRLQNINNKNFEDLLKNILKRSSDQVIQGFYTIKNASIKSLFNVSEINGISMSKFIYIHQPQVNLTGDIQFRSLSIEGNLDATQLLNDCALPKVEEQWLLMDNASVWFTVHISGDSEWPVSRDSHSQLQKLIHSAVTTSSEQEIHGAVTFQDVNVINIQVNHLNDKNISWIFQDSLSRKRKAQVISGKKVFFGSFKCDSMKVKGDVRSTYVNEVNINEINERLVRRFVDDDSLSKVVYGHKTFMSGFNTFHFDCSGGINGIPPSSLGTESYKEDLPPTTVPSLVVVNKLQVETINGLHIDTFLQDCIYVNHSKSQLITEQLHIKGDVVLQGKVTAPNINNVSTSELVFSEKGRGPNIINGCKIFSSDILIEKDSNINILNGKNLSKTYSESVKQYQNSTINGFISIQSDVDLKTIYAQKYYVGSKELIHLNTTFGP